MSKQPLLTVVIPVYNEERTLSKVLERVFASPLDLQVIVVNDGSTDGTEEVLAHSPFPILHLKNPVNNGKGASIRKALEHARGEYVIVQDADLEYDPQDFQKLLACAQRYQTPVVFGRRIRTWKEKIRHWKFFTAGKLLTWLANILYGCRVTDEPTCYKLVRTDLLKALDLQAQRFEFCPEVTAKVAKRGIRIGEVPISYSPRDKKGGKKIKYRDFFEAVWTLLRYRFRS